MVEMFECAICGLREFKPYLKINGVEIRKCNGCGLGRRVPFETRRGYGDDFGGRMERLEAWKVIHGAIYKKIETVVPIGSALELGCAEGVGLVVGQSRGWKAVGVELSKKAVRYGKSKFGVTIMTGDITKKLVINKKFDVIILNHVLEHLHSPQKVLRQIRLLLKPGGLVYIGVPNVGSLWAKVFKQKWHPWQIDQHLWFFKRWHLVAMVEKAGYTVARSGSIDVVEPYLTAGKLVKQLISVAVSGLGLAEGLFVLAFPKFELEH